jgi:3-hydroxy-9,10-secoandrosta-1,3,5(10)-triene-9,17-dione monooxygenase
MAVPASKRAESAAPAPEALIARARALIPVLRARAAACEDARRIPDETVRDLVAAGFFRITQPASAGGYAMSPSVLWAVAREIGRGCGSTAWIMSLLGLHPWLVGMFEPRAQDEVFADGDAIVPVLTGGVGRDLDVTAIAGGYEISGLWRYASGIDIATWVIAMVPLPRGGASEPHLILVPKSSFRIAHASWNVLGMRGTGSKDVRLERAFVPAHRVVPWLDAQRGVYPGSAVNREPTYRAPLNGLFAMSTAAAVVGVASGAVDHFVEAIKARTVTGTGQRQIEDKAAQLEAGQCAAQVHMAFALLARDVDEMYEIARRDDAFTLEQRARYRMDAALISRTALAAADRMFNAVGGSLLPSGAPLERCFRDIHAMASHFLLQPEPAGELYGRVLLGLDLPQGARV